MRITLIGASLWACIFQVIKAPHVPQSQVFLGIAICLLFYIILDVIEDIMKNKGNGK